MICSRTMKESDYAELVDEGNTIMDIQGAIQMWNPAQHRHRLWEYALAQKALKEVYGERYGLHVSDHGCGAGYLSPILFWLGHHVYMYECWAMGNEETFALEQMRRVAGKRPNLTGSYQLRSTPLANGTLSSEDMDMDAAFCISTIEHIGEYQKAWTELLSTVGPGGLAFITSDFAEDEVDHYAYSYLRAGKMFTKDTYQELISIGEQQGFHLLGGKHELTWGEENRLVNDYGFGALAMKRDV